MAVIGAEFVFFFPRSRTLTLKLSTFLSEHIIIFYKLLSPIVESVSLARKILKPKIQALATACH